MWRSAKYLLPAVVVGIIVLLTARAPALEAVPARLTLPPETTTAATTTPGDNDGSGADGPGNLGIGGDDNGTGNLDDGAGDDFRSLGDHGCPRDHRRSHDDYDGACNDHGGAHDHGGPA